MSQQPPYPPSNQPYAYPPQPPKQKSNTCLWVALITAVFLLLCTCACLLLAVVFADPLLEIAEEVASELDTTQPESNPSSQPVANPPQNTASTAASVSVSSGEATVVTAPDGAFISIPTGAVPAGDDGTAGTMVFSIEQVSVTEQNTAVADDLTLAGPLYRLGPEGFNFNTPIIVSLPIPAGTDPGTIAGLVTYDPQSGQMKLVPSFIDLENGVVSASTIHLSPWGIGRYYENLAQVQRETGGNITVHLPRTAPDPFTDNDGLDEARYNGRAFSYGVCIESYSLADNNPNTRIWPHWETPTGYLYVVHDSYHGRTQNPGPRSWWVPTGTYQLSEIVAVSEVNPGDPLYLPEYKNYWRPVGNVQMTPGGEVRFSFNDIRSEFHTWTEGRPNCFGLATSSAGTGDVQITLTWDSEDDLDLHVIDPSGEEIYYSNTSSLSGGQLDRDNQCSDFILGQPENVFWPVGSAPSGSYQVSVHYYGSCVQDHTVPWTVRIVTSGQVQTYSGAVSSSGEQQTVTTFTIP